MFLLNIQNLSIRFHLDHHIFWLTLLYHLNKDPYKIAEHKRITQWVFYIFQNK